MTGRAQEPGTLPLVSSYPRVVLPDNVRMSIRGMDDSKPMILLRVLADGRRDEYWLSLGDTVSAGGRTWRFEDIEFRDTRDQWVVFIQEVLPGTAPYVAPPLIPYSRTWPRADLGTFGPVDEAALTTLEQNIGSPLPPDYRRWLAANNGAAPTQDVWLKGRNFYLNDIHSLLGIHPETPHWDLSFGESRRKPWLTDDYLVIAVPLGGLLAVTLHGANRDQIVFLSDEVLHTARGRADPAAYLCPHSLVLVAQSIFVLTGNLQPAPPVEPAQLAAPGQPAPW